MDAKQPLRAVITYNDVVAAKRAMRVLADLDCGLGDSVDFQPLPWPFDLLIDADWHEAARSDLINADILIIATSHSTPLPPAVERWLQAVIEQKRGTDAAIVALFGTAEDPDSTTSVRLEAMRTAALRAGLQFFAPVAPVDLDEAIDRIHHRAATITPRLDEILRQHPAPHWGINE